jgi:hypothetical protein
LELTVLVGDGDGVTVVVVDGDDDAAVVGDGDGVAVLDRLEPQLAKRNKELVPSTTEYQPECQLNN